ncbi:hypothetical protein [Micromonospora nigra]|nr:hypothetical protein [Micromonospora nigra]
MTGNDSRYGVISAVGSLMSNGSVSSTRSAAVDRQLVLPAHHPAGARRDDLDGQDDVRGP